MSTGDLLGIAEMLRHPFMLRAFVAGTAIAAAAGSVGYFLVLRRQVFTGDALSHVAFTGALAALAAGIDLRIGLFGGLVTVALALGALDQGDGADDAVVGAVFAWVLGLGVLFLSLYTSSGASRNNVKGVTVLFGSILGFDATRTWTAVLTSLAVLIAVAIVVRPLLFASIDPVVARATGVPVTAIAYGFLVLVAVTAGVAAQAVGALLLLALVATPAAAASHLTVRPPVAIVISAAIAVGATWVGLTVSYRVDSIPTSVAITAALTTAYASARLASVARRERWDLRPPDRVP